MLGTSPSPISFFGAIRASLVDAWIPVFFAAWEISFCSLSSWAWWSFTSARDRQKDKLGKAALSGLLIFKGEVILKKWFKKNKKNT